jgi:hypothetical protein
MCLLQIDNFKTIKVMSEGEPLALAPFNKVTM